MARILCNVFILKLFFINYITSLNITTKRILADQENYDVWGRSHCKLEPEMEISNCHTPSLGLEILDSLFVPEGTQCFQQNERSTLICAKGKWNLQGKKTKYRKTRRVPENYAETGVNVYSNQFGAAVINEVTNFIARGFHRFQCLFSKCEPPPKHPPTINCPVLSQKEYVASEGETGVYVKWDQAKAYDHDNFGIGVRLTSQNPSGSLFKEGTHLISYMTQDSEGLFATCSFDFTVTVLRCPFDYTYLLHGSTDCEPKKNKNIFGSTCSYSCDVGFENTGTSTLRCLGNKIWNATKPVCQPIRCGKPPVVLNGNFTCATSDYVYNSTCALSCDVGYSPSQNDFLKCQSDKKWSPSGTCIDVEPPTIDCSPDIEAYYGPQLSKVNVTWNATIEKDNSGLPVNVSSNIPSGSSFENETTVVIFTAVDSSHNFAFCKKLVRLQVKQCSDYTKSNNSDVSCSHGNAYGSVCTTICQKAYELVSLSTQTCQENQSWSNEKPQCKPRPCPHVPYVSNGNYSCPTGTNYQDVCLLQCDAGFTAQAPLTITCNINVTWSQVGSCLDTQPPVFTDGCPASVVHEAASLGSPTYVNYNLPNVADNSKENITLHGNPISGSQFDIGTTTVTVIATDREGNFANCTFNITVIPTTCEAPNIDTSGKVLIDYNCPNQYVYGASCLLNCTDGNPINGPSSIKCDKLYTGLQWVWPGNVKPYCNAQVCKKLDAPENGALSCDSYIVGTELCTLICNINFTYPSSAPNDYSCSKGTWSPYDHIPGCTVRRQTGDVLTKPVFYYFSGACSSNNSEIKDNFLHILNGTVFSDACGDDGCKVDTVEVTCGAVTQQRRKKNVNSFKYSITAVISLGKYKDHGSKSTTLAFYERVVSNINNRINLVADSGKFDMPIGNLENFKYGESTFTCNDGESFVYSTMSCAGCGPGFTYNNSTKKCDTCPQGTYQDQDISFTCTKCPDGTTTRKNMSTSITDCQDLCLPGSVSNTGFQNCTPCPVGKFASQYGMKECQLCPYGMSTMTPGASSIQICLFTDFRINENTSRPAIQISDAVPKKFTFMAWISEVSSFQTSTFIFSIQSPSDNSAALVLDTISLHIERNADVTLRKLRKWNHVALVYTSPNVTLLVNGQHVETLNVLPVSELHTKDIFFRSSSSIKSILVSGMQMTRTTYTESQIKAFSSSCSRQVDKHELAYKPWEILVTSQITCNDKDLCTDEPCGPYGVCVSGTDTLTCICDDPWKGDRCEIAPDYCVGHHCAKGSTCLNQPHDKGYSCLCPNFYKGALCNEPHFPVDGDWGSWGQWSSCSVQCGTGQISRTRLCDNPKPENDGLSCQGEESETEQCETECKDCRWGQWTQWTCSVSCGEGVATRTRSIASAAVNGGRRCSGPNTNTRSCTVSLCPVHGGFGAWEEWSGCSSSCGGGVSTRRRSCDNPFPAHGGNMCNETLAEETKQCNTQECPVCKLPDLREGQTKWNCSTDEAGLQTCNIVCSPGLVLMPTTYNIFQCGPVTNYTWSQQTPDNPVGLTPSCSDQKTPESISSVITTTFDVDCSQESLTLGIRNHVHEQLTRDECFSKNNCFHTVDTHSSCRTSRKRSIGTMVLNVSLNSVGNDTDSAYFGGLKEEDIAAQRMKVLSFEKVVEDIFTKNETIFTATVDGVTYRGQIQSVEARFICQPGSGFVGGMCVDCPAGTYSPGNGSCLYCEKGFYQDKANSAVCKKCPTGTTTSGRGSYSLNHCTTNPLTYLDVYPYQFYPSPNKETPNKQHPNHKDDGVSTTIVIAAVTSSVTFLLMLGVVVFILIKKYGQSISKTAPEGYIDLHVSSVEGTK